MVTDLSPAHFRAPRYPALLLKMLYPMCMQISPGAPCSTTPRRAKARGVPVTARQLCSFTKLALSRASSDPKVSQHLPGSSGFLPAHCSSRVTATAIAWPCRPCHCSCADGVLQTAWKKRSQQLLAIMQTRWGRCYGRAPLSLHQASPPFPKVVSESCRSP